jgi:hypothetical protein
MENKGLDEASAVETVFAEIEEQQRKASLKRIVEAFDNLDSGDPSVQSLIEEQHSIEADLRESLAASRVQEPSEPGTEEVSTGLLKSEDRPASVSDADYRRGRPRRVSRHHARDPERHVISPRTSLGLRHSLLWTIEASPSERHS